MLIKLKEVEKITSLSRSTIYRKIQEGSFPKQIKISHRSSAWLKSEITDWIEGLSYENKVE